MSVLADNFYMIAPPWLVLQLTGDSLAMGAVLALAAVPRALLMLVGGALTDHFSVRSQPRQRHASAYRLGRDRCLLGNLMTLNPTVRAMEPAPQAGD